MSFHLCRWSWDRGLRGERQTRKATFPQTRERSLRRLGRRVPQARETGGPRRARVDASGGQAPPRADRDPSEQVASANPRGPRPIPRGGDKGALRDGGVRHRDHPGDVGDPAANPVHPTPSGRVIRPRAAEQSAPPSAAACTAGRKTGGPLYGAAAPGGGGRHPEADPRRAPSATLGLQCHPYGTLPRDR